MEETPRGDDDVIATRHVRLHPGIALTMERTARIADADEARALRIGGSEDRTSLSNRHTGTPACTAWL